MQGIHLEEALDQLRTSPYLKEMNHAAAIDRALVGTVNEIRRGLMGMVDSILHEEIEDLAFFVPWDLKRNIPKVTIDIAGVLFDAVWIA